LRYWIRYDLTPDGLTRSPNPGRSSSHKTISPFGSGLIASTVRLTSFDMAGAFEPGKQGGSSRREAAATTLPRPKYRSIAKQYRFSGKWSNRHRWASTTQWQVMQTP